jgi:Uma2 family endonuclease
VSIPAQTWDANEKAWSIEADLAGAAISCITSDCGAAEDVSAAGRRGDNMKAAKNHRFETIADLLRDLGGISARRVRADPLPGTATEKDLIAANDHSNRLFELVNGVLVEKAVGYAESFLMCEMVTFLRLFLREHPLGILTGADGPLRLEEGLVRLPDISFVSWEQLPGRTIPLDPIAGLFPDLAVEILSKGNTKKEMARKRREYFFAGTRLVWQVDKDKRTVEVFTTPDQSVVLTEEQTLDGGDVLPGFSLPVRQIFAALPAGGGTAKKTSRRRKRG